MRKDIGGADGPGYTTGQTGPRDCLATSCDTFPCLVVEGGLSTLSRLGDLPGSCENVRQSRIGRLGVTVLRQPIPGSQQHVRGHHAEAASSGYPKQVTA